MEDTFTSLDSNGDPIVKQQTSSQECVLQKLLILDHLPQMMKAMLEWSTHQDCVPQMLRFLAHLVLVLRMMGQPVCLETGDKIIKAYVKVP